MYLYFVNFQDFGAPSFEKYARQKGITLAELLGYRAHSRFEKAYAECLEIRRDFLIDKALSRGFDPSFVKYLLEAEGGSAPAEITFKLEVIE